MIAEVKRILAGPPAARHAVRVPDETSCRSHCRTISRSLADTQDSGTSRGWRRLVYEWLTGTPPAPQPSSAPRIRTIARAFRPASATTPSPASSGEGGMGVVYAARDERLERVVAVKTMTSPANDETARKRFWREARAAASMTHPNICQIHEIGEHAGTLFLAMELLEGESLGDRLRRGPLRGRRPADRARHAGGAVGVHGRGLVHRDLKPSNVFLTPHGVKLLDFGLARPVRDGARPDHGVDADRGRARHPRYMAPEQATGDPVDARCDLFAAAPSCSRCWRAAPPWRPDGHRRPPRHAARTAAGADRLVGDGGRRPRDPPGAGQAAGRPAVLGRPDGGGARGVRDASDEPPALAHALTRLVVLPFRVLRPDPETDFLAFSLPDAIATHCRVSTH